MNGEANKGLKVIYHAVVKVATKKVENGSGARGEQSSKDALDEEEDEE